MIRKQREARETKLTLAVIFSVVLFMFIGMTTVSADNIRNIDITNGETFFTDKGHYVDDLYPVSLKKSETIISVKSSNLDVIKVKLNNTDNPVDNVILGDPHPGNSIVTVVIKNINTKKKRTEKYYIKVLKYTCPFKSLKVAGKNYIKDLSRMNDTIDVPTKNKYEKIEYKLKKGWKIVKKSKATYRKSSVYPVIKSGTKLKTSSSPIMLLRNENTGVEMTLWIDFEKSKS